MWSDVNFKEKTISITKAVTYDENKNLTLGSTKTGDTRTL